MSNINNPSEATSIISFVNPKNGQVYVFIPIGLD